MRSPRDAPDGPGSLMGQDRSWRAGLAQVPLASLVGEPLVQGELERPGPEPVGNLERQQVTRESRTAMFREPAMAAVRRVRDDRRIRLGVVRQDQLGAVVGRVRVGMRSGVRQPELDATM